MGTLLAKMDEGAQGTEERLTQLGVVSLEGLATITAQNDEQAAQAESGFAQQMSGIRAGASKAFGTLTGNHIKQCTQAMTEGVASMKQAVAGFDKALATIGGNIDKAIASSLKELDQDLSKTLGGLDAKIASEAWKAAEKEQPAWKSVVAIVLVIIVIIVAAVISIVTLGAGASLFAVILVGALVGAVSAGLIQIINNWASGEAWDTGLVQAMVMGAIGGAIGGGLGFAGGALSAGAAVAGARVATQVLIHVGTDLIAEGLTQTVGYFAYGQKFSWQGFVTAGVMSGVSFRAHVGGPHGGTAHPEVSVPHAGGAGGGRRAAVAQVAGGAAVGLGVEYATSKISGEKFDMTRAASSAASGAVGAHMSRRGGAAGHAPEQPTSALGRAAERVRSFDPGGVGARLEGTLKSAGGRLVGGPAAPERPAGGTPRVEEPAATSRTTEEPATAPRSAEEPTTAPRTTEEPAATPRSTEEPTAAEQRRQPGDESQAANEARAREVSEMHPDADLAAPGASHPLDLGQGNHGISAKRAANGEVVLTSCSNCAILRDRLNALANDLPPGSPARERAEVLAREASELQQRINDGKVTDIAGETRALAARVNAAAGDLPDLRWTLLNHLESASLQPRPPIAPEPGGRIDAASQQEFGGRTGGTGRGGWFESENMLSPTARANPQGVMEQAQNWYNVAKTTEAVPALGEFGTVRDAVRARAEERAARGNVAQADVPPELYRLNVPQELWQLQVNDAWILGHAERGSTFQVVSNPTARSNLETRLAVDGNPRNRTGDVVQSVFGRELQVLESHGYQFVQDSGPKNIESTRGISGRMVPPSEVAQLAAQGYVWKPYTTPAGHFEGITGRWVKPAVNPQ